MGDARLARGVSREMGSGRCATSPGSPQPALRPRDCLGHLGDAQVRAVVLFWARRSQELTQQGRLHQNNMLEVLGISVSCSCGKLHKHVTCSQRVNGWVGMAQKQPEAIPERPRPPLQPACSLGFQASPRLPSCLNTFNDFTVAWCRLYINSKVLLTQRLGLVRGQRSPGETQAVARGPGWAAPWAL